MFAVSSNKESRSIVYRNVSKKLLLSTLLTIAYIIGSFFVCHIFFALLIALFSTLNIFVVWRVELKAMTNIQNIVVGDIFSVGEYTYMVLSEKDNANFKILCLQTGEHHELLNIENYDFT